MARLLPYLVLALPYVGVYAMLGLGITVIYQASRVINLAHGAIAVSAAYATYQLHRWHLPVPVAVVGGVIAGGALGLAVEVILVRRLRTSGPTTQTVGTVAVLSLAIALAVRLFGSSPINEVAVIPSHSIAVGAGHVSTDLLALFPIGVVGAGLLFLLLQFTDVGLAMRGAAQNRRGAALRGVNPDLTTSLAWVVGGAYAGLTGILLSSATVLDPFSISLGVLPAFIAALIGGLDSMPGVLLGAILVGLVQGMVPAFGLVPRLGNIDPGAFAQGQGAPVLVLGVVALVAMGFRGARLSTGDAKSADAL
jgi:branched-subunit amino acid ABC-type transport system permease component